MSMLAPAGIPRLREITLDPAVLAFAVGLSLASALLFGSIPVARFGGRRLALTLQGGGRVPATAASATARDTSSSWSRSRSRSCCS
jgi:hypothetical protein